MQDAEFDGHAVRVLAAVVELERQPRDAALVQPAVGPVGQVAEVAVVQAAHTQGRGLHQHAKRLARLRRLLAGR